MLILRSCNGQALRRLDSSRISSQVAWPVVSEGGASTNGRLVEVALSGAIASMVDLKRTAGDGWGPDELDEFDGFKPDSDEDQDRQYLCRS